MMVVGDLCKNNVGDYGVVRRIDYDKDTTYFDVLWSNDSKTTGRYSFDNNDLSRIRCSDGNVYPAGLIFQYIGGDKFYSPAIEVDAECVCKAVSCDTCCYRGCSNRCHNCGKDFSKYVPTNYCAICGRRLVPNRQVWDKWQSVYNEVRSGKRLSGDARDYVIKLMEAQRANMLAKL